MRSATTPSYRNAGGFRKQDQAAAAALTAILWIFQKRSCYLHGCPWAIAATPRASAAAPRRSSSATWARSAGRCSTASILHKEMRADAQGAMPDRIRERIERDAPARASARPRRPGGTACGAGAAGSELTCSRVCGTERSEFWTGVTGADTLRRTGRPSALPSGLSWRLPSRPANARAACPRCSLS